MENDDELKKFEMKGATPLPSTKNEGYVENKEAKIWYAKYGSGYPVIMLHGGYGNSKDWGYQVDGLINSGYEIIVIDSRGHGRSTRNSLPYSYELMVSDVLAVLDKLKIKKAGIVGWSDGAIISLLLAMEDPSRVSGVFFFGCKMDLSGVKEIEPSPVLSRCFKRHMVDYAELSETPDQFNSFVSAVGKMEETQPNYSASDLKKIKVPVAIVQSEHDEFIKPEHFKYLSQTIPGAKHIFLPEVSHFAPIQRPDQFNKVLIEFLDSISTK